MSNMIYVYAKFHKLEPISFAARCDNLDKQFYAEFTLPNKTDTIPGLPFHYADYITPPSIANLYGRFVMKDTVEKVTEEFRLWQLGIKGPLYNRLQEDIFQDECNDFLDKILGTSKGGSFKVEKTQENAIKFLRDYIKREINKYDNCK